MARPSDEQVLRRVKPGVYNVYDLGVHARKARRLMHASSRWVHIGHNLWRKIPDEELEQRTELTSMVYSWFNAPAVSVTDFILPAAAMGLGAAVVWRASKWWRGVRGKPSIPQGQGWAEELPGIGKSVTMRHPEKDGWQLTGTLVRYGSLGEGAGQVLLAVLQDPIMFKPSVDGESEQRREMSGVYFVFQGPPNVRQVWKSQMDRMELSPGEFLASKIPEQGLSLWTDFTKGSKK